MMKYLGILLILIGAILLVLSYYLGWVDVNAVQFTGLALMIAGLIAHIVITKRIKS